MITALLVEGTRERKKLDKIRQQISATEQELEDCAAAPFPVEESLDRFMRQVDHQRELAETRVSYFTRPGDGPELPPADAGFYSFLLGRDEFVTLMRERLEGLTGTPGLPRSEREQRLADLREKLATLEEDEEREICTLEARGCAVDRRDVDAELLLGVWDSLDF